MYRLLGLLMVVALTAGCGVKAETYVMTRDRIYDTKGNGGYLAGKGEVKEPVQKTRKIYVLEFTKAVPEPVEKTIKEETITQTTEKVEAPEVSEPAQTSQQLAAHREVVIPAIEDESMPVEAKSAGPSEAVEYVVQKDDTLQKIAHKYYNSYGKWTKIYEANKDKIKNPNILRAGTKITIPAVK